MADQMSAVDAPSDPLSYGPSYFRHSCGIPYRRNKHWLEFFGGIADGIVRDLHPASVLDAGCAMGLLVEALVERGVDASGVDISEHAISEVIDEIADRCRVASVTDPIDQRFDLIVAIEVLEHLPAAEAEIAIANLCGATNQVLFSSTPDDYGEATHLNVQPPEYWSALLAREGFFRDVERDFSYIAPWAALYQRQDEPTEETVRRYDRSWWRLRRETEALRRALLASRQELAHLEEETAEPQRAEVLSTLDQLRQENLRLRDLLIGKDAELGAVRGSLAMHEDQSRRLVNAASRVQSKIPGGMRLAGAALRRIQRRG